MRASVIEDSASRVILMNMCPADRDLLLVNMLVAVQDEVPGNYPDNFLVYKADTDTPWLRSLPSPVDWIDPRWPWMPNLPRLLHWIGRREGVGIARSGEEFLVANLTINYSYSSETTGAWALKTERRWQTCCFTRPRRTCEKNGCMGGKVCSGSFVFIVWAF